MRALGDLDGTAGVEFPLLPHPRAISETGEPLQGVPVSEGLGQEAVVLGEGVNAGDPITSLPSFDQFMYYGNPEQ